MIIAETLVDKAEGPVVQDGNTRTDSIRHYLRNHEAEPQVIFAALHSSFHSFILLFFIYPSRYGLAVEWPERGEVTHSTRDRWGVGDVHSD